MGGGNTRDEVNTRTIPGFWTSQRPQPADPRTRDRIGGFVRSKRAQPIAALVTKVLDDEPTMAEDWPLILCRSGAFLGPELAVVLGSIYLSFLFKSFFPFRIGKCNRISENYRHVPKKKKKCVKTKIVEKWSLK